MLINKNDYSLQTVSEKIKNITNKAGLKADINNVGVYCNSFYFNQQ